jgi:hypothetical protein
MYAGRFAWARYHRWFGRACRDATAGRTCIGLLRGSHKNFTAKRWGTGSWSTGARRGRLRAGPSGTRTTSNSLRRRDYGPASPRGFSTDPSFGRIPETVIRHSARRARRPVGGAGLSRGLVSRKTRGAGAGGRSGAMGSGKRMFSDIGALRRMRECEFELRERSIF